MLIRSQDKKILCPFNAMGICPVTIHENEIKIQKYKIYTSVHGDEVEMSEYSTEEKAIKVLDMIQETYIREFKEITEEVYQMPQDSEV